MPAPILWRPDNSGGWMISRYTNGNVTHRMRTHFDLVSPTDTTLTYLTPNGTEHTVLDTWAALIALLRPFYTSAWSFSLDSVYVSNGPDPNFPGENQFTELYGWTPPTPVAGNGPNADTTADLPMQQTYNFHTTQGGRARLVLLSISGVGYYQPYMSNSGSGGPASVALANYVVGANTGIRGHDGHKLTGAARITTTVNRRIRRRLNQA